MTASDMMKLSSWSKISLVLSSFIFVYGAARLLYFLKSRGISFPIEGTWGFPLSMLVIITISCAIMILAGRQSLRDVGFRMPKKSDWRWLLAFLFFLMPIAIAGRLLDPGWDAWYADQTGLATTTGLTLFTVTMPLYAMKEEFMVRGIFQNKTRSLGFWWMAFAVSLNFAIAHYYVPVWGLTHILVWVLSVFVGSFLLIMCYEVTRNIWISILLHLIFNVLIGLQIFLHVSHPAAETVFWIAMMVGFLITMRLSFKTAFSHFNKERFCRIGWRDAVFLFLFAVVYPIFLVISWKLWAIGFAATAWLFFI